MLLATGLVKCIDMDSVLQPVDGKAAASWFRRGAERGDAPSQNALSGMLIQGTHVPESFEEARYWLEKAAAQGNEAAIENLMSLLTTLRRSS